MIRHRVASSPVGARRVKLECSAGECDWTVEAGAEAAVETLRHERDEPGGDGEMEVDA